MSSSYSIAEFRKKMQTMNDNFVAAASGANPSIQTIATGNSANASPPVYGYAAGANGSTSSLGLDSYYTFAGALTASVGLTEGESNVYYRTGSATTYTTFVTGSTFPAASPPTEMNFYSLTLLQTGNGLAIRTYLENLQKAYGLLLQFQQLMSGNVITVNTYSRSTVYYKFDSVNGHITYDSQATPDATTGVFANALTDATRGELSIVNINTLLTNNAVLMNTDIFVLSRICLLQILMINSYIALFLYDSQQTNPTPSGPANLADATTILQATINVFETHNDNMYTNDSNGGGISSILGAMNDRITSFKTTRDGITDANTVLKSNKLDLQGNVDRVNSQVSGSTGPKWYQYLAMSILIVISVVQGLVITSDLADEKKTVYTMGIFAIAIIVAIILYIIEVRFFSVPVEGFDAGSTVISDSYSSGIINSASSMAGDVSLFSDAIIKLANAFIDNTLYIGLALQSYEAYGLADYSMQKELSYYTDQNYQMQTTSAKLRNTGNIIALNARDSYARTMFFIELLVILSTTAMLYVVSTPMPSFHPYILGLGGIALVVAMFIYILAINSKVRTDSAKVYWGKPNTAGI